MMKRLRHMLAMFALLAAGLALGACGTVTESVRGDALAPAARWVMLPFVNAAQTPQAGERAQAIAGTLLRRRGLSTLADAPAADADNGLPALDDARRVAAATTWARDNGYRYGVGGTITEWGYKTGMDGEPAVGVTLTVTDLRSGQVVWSASGARSGWGFSSLSGTAQKLLDRLVARMPLGARATP